MRANEVLRWLKKKYNDVACLFLLLGKGMVESIGNDLNERVGSASVFVVGPNVV